MKALILAACLTLAACAGTPFSYDNARQVKPGMSEDQVYQLMGNPYRVVSRNGEQMWVYSFATALGNAKAVSFKMAGGHITEVPTIPDSFK